MEHGHHTTHHVHHEYYEASNTAPTHHKRADTHADHDKHAGHHTADFLKRFWICITLTLPVLLLSHVIQQWAGFHLTFPGDRYVLFFLGTAIYVYGGMPFLKGMVREIKGCSIGMMTLVALAISDAFFYSVAVI